MRLAKALKKINRTVLEMHLGILAFGMICQIIGAFLVQRQGYYAASLWFGILLALCSVIHMYRTLDRALDYDEKNASRIIFIGYLTRYVLLVVFLIIISINCYLCNIIVFCFYICIICFCFSAAFFFVF